jgi:hypothetical protein
MVNPANTVMNLPRFAAAFLLFSSFALADDPVVAVCKKLVADHQDSLVNVTAVAKLTIGGGGTRGAPQERKMEAPGTVLDAGGLIVTSLARLDPSAMMASMSSTFKGMESSLQDVKVVMGDGTEIPAQIVLKDTDLDLAFVKADLGSKEAKGVAFKALDLGGAAKVSPGDGVIGLARADESVGRVPGVRRDYVFAVTKRPREFVLVSGDFMGSPVFAESGKIIGIGILRPGRTISRSSIAIASADDVKEVLEQAKVAKPRPLAAKKEPAVDETPKIEPKKALKEVVPGEAPKDEPKKTDKKE